MKKVLIALDYGLSAHKIAEQGFDFAKCMNAKVSLLHVVADESYYNIIDSAPLMALYGYNFFNIMNGTGLIDSSLNFLEKIKSNLNDSNIEVQAVQGDSAKVILEIAEDQNFDLIIVGSHNQNWLEKAVMGSVTESIVAKSKIPIFIIPINDHQ